MQKRLLIFLSFLLSFISANAQKWQNGYFYDIKGNKVPGQIRLYPSGKPPIKDEAFGEYREDSESGVIKLSASGLRSFVVARDSFVVAANGGWSNYELDFVRVALDGAIRLFQASGGGGGDSGFGISPGVGIGGGGGTGGLGGGW